MPRIGPKNYARRKHRLSLGMKLPQYNAYVDMQERLAFQLSIVVVAIKDVSYFSNTLPRIRRYCEKYEIEYVEFRQDFASPHHPSWNKLKAVESVSGNVLLWDADLVPMWHAPDIRRHLNRNQLGMVWIAPTGMGRSMLRRRYGRESASRMYYNCGLVYVPASFRMNISSLWGDFSHAMWEQGAINHAVVQNNWPVHSVDQRWNRVKMSRGVDMPLLRDNFAVHFARGTRRKTETIAQMVRLLKDNGIDW